MTNDKIVDYINYGEYAESKRRHSQVQDVENILNELNLSFEKEKTFDDLVWKNKLKFDFYIDELNCLIEFDGEQHYYKVDYFNDTIEKFRLRQMKDHFKSNYALYHFMNLIRIPFWFTSDDIRDRIISLLQDGHIKLNIKDQKYFNYFAKTVDPSIVRINDVYNDYLKMIKDLHVISHLSYTTFKSCLIHELDLEFKNIIHENNRWFEIYSELNDEDYQTILNTGQDKNKDIKELVIEHLTILYNENELDYKYILKRGLYNCFLNWSQLSQGDIKFKAYINYIKGFFDNKDEFKNTTRSRKTISTINNEKASYLPLNDSYDQSQDRFTYYINKNFK